MKLHRRSLWLSIDSLINLLLGALLVVFPRDLVSFLGLPQAGSAFYPGILGAVLIGIGIALWMERGTDRAGGRGLGLGGAVVINLCAALVLAAWLLFGDLSLSARGSGFLWGIVAVLIVVSLAEIACVRRTLSRSNEIPRLLLPHIQSTSVCKPHWYGYTYRSTYAFESVSASANLSGPSMRAARFSNSSSIASGSGSTPNQ